MAMTSTRTLNATTLFRVSSGTFTNGATDTGGTIDTGLKSISFAAVSFGSHVDSGNGKVTWTAGSPNITIVCNEGADGYWIAFGRV